MLIRVIHIHLTCSLVLLLLLISRDEQGEFYGIDLGGTNLRVLWIRLGSEKSAIDAQDVGEWPIPDECYDTDNGRLLAWVAEKAEEVMQRHGVTQDSPQTSTLGFCFSFACEQSSLGDGKLLLWTKSFRGKGLIGEDVVAALASEFSARGLSVRIPALMNDTVATLIAMCYSDPSTQAGIILGTGTNCAYLEKTECITKLPPPPSSVAHTGTGDDGEQVKEHISSERGPLMVINSEWGDLDSSGRILPRCEEDLWVDCSSANPGHGLFEKLIAGLYMGEVARRIFVRLVEHGGLFGGSRAHPIGSLIAKEGSFTSANLSTIDQDESLGLEVTAATVQSCFNLRNKPSLRDLKVVREVCGLVALRSARLCAAAIAAVYERCRGGVEEMGAINGEERSAGTAGSGGAVEPFVIAVDGSVFSKYPAYKVKLQSALVELMGTERAAAVTLKLVDGGSVAGAAYLAAAAVNR